MRKSEQGFSVIETFLVIAVIAVVAGVGLMVYSRSSGSKSVNPGQQATKTTPVAGTVESIDALSSDDVKSESEINSRYEASDQATAKATNSAAADLEGAYDASTL